MRDTELLAALGQVLEAEPAEPSALEIERLHLAVSAAAAASVFSTAGPRSLRSRLARPVPVLVAAMLTVASGGTAAALTGASLPAPLRSVANAVGLPVDDTSVATAKSVMADLQAALAAGDRARIAAGAGRLRDLIGTMSGGDRARIEPSAERLLAQAAQVLGVVESPKRPGTPASETPPPPSTSAPTTETPSTETPSTEGPSSTTTETRPPSESTQPGTGEGTTESTTTPPASSEGSNTGSDGNTTSGDTTTTTAATGAEQPSTGSDGAAGTTTTTSSSSDTSTSGTNNAAPGN